MGKTLKSLIVIFSTRYFSIKKTKEPVKLDRPFCFLITPPQKLYAYVSGTFSAYQELPDNGTAHWTVFLLLSNYARTF